MEQEAPILVVEDQPELLELLGILLDFEQYRVALMTDGQEAVDWLAHDRPALVILEWLLPKVGGDRVIAGTRERYGAEVPILVLSTGANSTMARLAGADAYLRKPYHIDDLVSTVHQLLAPYHCLPWMDDCRSRPCRVNTVEQIHRTSAPSACFQS
jgi:DNA-binding response OmpR family regulator